MRIGILTGGGDVPGLNNCIKAVVRGAHDNHWEVLGFRRGWAGLLQFNPDDDAASKTAHTVELNAGSTRTIDRSGGTILHTSRTNPGKVPTHKIPDFLKQAPASTNQDGHADCTAHILKVLEHLGIDALVPIGGDDTLSYAARLHDEGVRILAVPKTMDNDVNGTDYCIGFSTAISRSIEFINALRTPAGSHERIAVVEVFGRYCGETALVSGYLSDADRTLIAEVPFDIDRLGDLLLADRRSNPSRYAMLIVSEGARPVGERRIERGETDAYGHRKLGGIGQILSDELQTRTGIGTICQSLAYLMRAGPPDSLDRMVASSYGHMAVELLAAGEAGLMTALQDGKYTAADINKCVSGTRRVDVDAFYDQQAYKPRISVVRGKPMFMY